MSAPKVYGLFDPPPDEGIDCSQGLGADQSFKDECDINVIMARAERTGELINPWVVGNRVGSYLDVSTAPDDFLQARLIMQDAEQRFAELPARIRARFNNDAEQLLQFLSDPGNRAEAIELGLVTAPEKPVVPPAAPASSTSPT